MKNFWNAFFKKVQVLTMYFKELANGASYAIQR
jgi:hypothetical protein